MYKEFEGKKADLEGDLREKLDELLKDVEYVFKIREMEGFQQNAKSRDHVPSMKQTKREERKREREREKECVFINIINSFWIDCQSFF